MRRLRLTDDILSEIEEIIDGVQKRTLGHEEAKIRMWGAKNAIRLHALKFQGEQLAFQKAVFGKVLSSGSKKPRQLGMQDVPKGARSSR